MKRSNKNVEAKIDTERPLSDEDVRRLAFPRRCGRELVGAERGPEERCSMGAAPFEAACRHHITKTEKDAAMLARVGFRMAAELGRQGLTAETINEWLRGAIAPDRLPRTGDIGSRKA